MLTALGRLGPVGRMAGLILALLVVASLVLAVIRRLRPGLELGEVAARVRSWWVMAAVFFGALAVTPLVSLAFFAFMSFWAMKEYVTLLRTRPADHRALFLAFSSIPLQYYWIARSWYGMFIIFIPVYMFLVLPFRLVLSKETAGFVASCSQIQWGLMAFVFGLSHLAFLLVLPVAAVPPVGGRTLLLFLVFVVEMSDVLQFLWGKSLGRHRIIPSVSPNKTWEGAVGGILSASALSLLIRFLTPFSSGETFGVALLVTVAGFCGGAVMSAVKRDFGVKDFGAVIPGHGGVLDRVDSLCYAAPLFFHYVRYFHT
jgi:phosphatidate cytidylyltransferase